MWHRASVEQFLKDTGKSVETIADFNTKADQVADKDGNFASANLDQLIGADLARTFERAWETNSKYPHIAFKASRKSVGRGG